MKKSRFPGDSDVASDIRERYGFDGDLLDIYAGNAGGKVHKWPYSLPLYERYFSQYRNTPFKFLEIGVNNGGSMQMWQRYFGQSGTVRMDHRMIPNFWSKRSRKWAGSMWCWMMAATG